MATRKKSAKAASKTSANSAFSAKTARVEMKAERQARTEPNGGGTIQSAKGKLGVMIPGMGAVATTFVAGVEAIRRDLAKPIGSLTQMGTVRLGKRTEGRSPKIKEFVPLAGLDDLVFTGWDIFEDNMYEAASHAGVLDYRLLERLKPFLSSLKPRAAVFDHNYVKRINGPNVKKGKTKMDLAGQLRDDIRDYLFTNGMSRDEYAWFMNQKVAERSVLGVDYYQWNEKLIDSNGRAESLGELFGWYVITKQYYERYKRPIMHTETNCPDEHARRRPGSGASGIMCGSFVRTACRLSVSPGIACRTRWIGTSAWGKH